MVFTLKPPIFRGYVKNSTFAFNNTDWISKKMIFMIILVVRGLKSSKKFPWTLQRSLQALLFMSNLVSFLESKFEKLNLFA